MKEGGWYGNAKTEQKFNQQKFCKSFACVFEMERIGQVARNPERLLNSGLQSEQGDMATEGQNCYPYAGAIAWNCQFHQVSPTVYLVHFKGGLWNTLKLPIVSARDWWKKQCGLCFAFRELKRVCQHTNISRFLWKYSTVLFFPHILLHAAMSLCRVEDVVLVYRTIKYTDDTCAISICDMSIKCILHALEFF